MDIQLGKMRRWIILELLILLTVLFEKGTSAPQERMEEGRILQGEVTTVYNFPFLCTYRFYPAKGEPIVLGSCTIYSKDRVVIAVDTVDRLINQTEQFWFQKVSQISVIAGSDILDPPDPTGEHFVQLRKVAHFYVGMVENFKKPQHIVQDPNAFPTTFERNALGELACDIGVFVLDKPWDFNPLVLPMPLPTVNYDDLNKQVADWIGNLNKSPLIFDACSIGGWGPIGNNDIMVLDLVYIGWDECWESICAHHPSTCLEYPVFGDKQRRHHHICLKSRDYGDVCVYDQGSPLYCPWFGKGVFAILTRSFDCGLENMPAIYTVISYVAQFNKFVGTDQKGAIEARPDYNDPKYILNPKDKPPP
ncbi:hypothetical protein GE061_005563 [Apolygus lucorum]|uniref:Uncharacterized protein n=1 Tax=Apolygus lucorum TaxID=248454 RepID=A0A6A4K5L0_APOLU|nr:hypothetical protein GE061_005563 [Apolygus lucorum]